MYATKQIEISAEFLISKSGTPGLLPVALEPGSWQRNCGLGSMSQCSAQILICITIPVVEGHHGRNGSRFVYHHHHHGMIWNTIFTGINTTHFSVARQTCIDTDQMTWLKGNCSHKRLKVTDCAKIEASWHLSLACLIGVLGDLIVFNAYLTLVVSVWCTG